MNYEQLKRYRQTHPEYRVKARVYAKQYRLLHPEVKKKWLDNNPDYHRQYNAVYSKTHPEKMREKKQRYAKRHPDRIQVYNKRKRQEDKPKLLYFTPIGRKINLGKKLRTGFCSLCTNNIYDRSCKRTHLHHTQYHNDDPLKDTMEICVSCHTKETWKERRRN